MKKVLFRIAAISTAVTLSFGLVGCGNKAEQEKSSSSAAVAEQTEPEKTAPIVKTDDEIVTEAIKDTLEYHSNSLCKYKMSKANSTAETIIVELSAEPGWDSKSTIESYNDTAKYIFAALYQSSLSYKVENINISFYTTLTNSKTGAESDERIYSISLNAESASQMKWDNVKNIDITKSGNGIYIHPALKNM